MRGLAPHYQVVLTREERLDELEVRVEALPSLTVAAERQISAAELGNHIKSVIGVTARITVTDPGGVERSQGKARRVIDKRKA